jgi:hypothetical protein
MSEVPAVFEILLLLQMSSLLVPIPMVCLVLGTLFLVY